MTQIEHLHQHNQGELSCLVRFRRDPDLKASLQVASPQEALFIAEGWFDAQVEKYRELWRERTGTAPWEKTEHANA
jgi:hypothetical protein